MSETARQQREIDELTSQLEQLVAAATRTANENVRANVDKLESDQKKLIYQVDNSRSRETISVNHFWKPISVLELFKTNILRRAIERENKEAIENDVLSDLEVRF